MAKELEEKWVVASAMVDPPELSRMEEHRWVAAKTLVDRQAVVEARDQKAAKATPLDKMKMTLFNVLRIWSRNEHSRFLTWKPLLTLC